MKREIVLLSNGDTREQVCCDNWPKRKETLAALGHRCTTFPGYDQTHGHGMITTQAQGARIKIGKARIHDPPETPQCAVLAIGSNRPPLVPLPS